MSPILIVDDDEATRNILKDQIQKRGFTVVVASNGLEAILVASQSVPALILMDVNMPELDGLEATMKIRESDSDKRIPVIALTAYALPDDKARAIDAGCDEFHPKPVDLDKLLDQINQLIGQELTAGD